MQPLYLLLSLCGTTQKSTLHWSIITTIAKTEIPEYTYEEFETISIRIIEKLHQNTIMQIASSVWKTGSRNIRDVLKIAKLCNPTDTDEDINRLFTMRNLNHK